MFLETKIEPGMIIYELGSGSGVFTFLAAKSRPKRVIGYDLSPLHVVFCKLWAWAMKSKAEFYCRDFFKADLSDADLIYFWLVPKVAEQTWKKLKRECKPGTLVIQFGSKLADIKPIKSFPTNPDVINSAKLHFYVL